MIWIFIAALALGSMGFLALSLRAKTTPETQKDSTPAIFADQLAELDRDVARGVVSAADADAARIEIKKNILREAQKGTSAPIASSRSSLVGLVTAMFFVPMIAIGYYIQFGNPELSRLAVAEQQQAREENARVVALTEQLKTRLETDAEGGPSDGWMLLGQTYMRLGRFNDAAEAFRTVSERDEATSAVFSMLTEALVAQENGIITPAAEAAINEAAARDASNPAVTYFRALALQQAGQSAAAYDLVAARLDAADGYYPWIDTLVAQANRIGDGIGRDPISMAQFTPKLAGRGPSAEDVAATEDMSTEDRAAFIQSMVQGLADRLKEEPNDLDGWLQLGRAYSVLGNVEGAKDAYQKAAALSADLEETDPRKSIAAQALKTLSR
ncbi:c-type cytochrome biogenesis protein CcmI [Sulfitobacter mediterraneus]|uniref:c-type cytochrome biogenesis protein CcmI n=1 Tax=Sulfitobacter mediterraneus TaxID=83219 RepID=UPI001933D1C6|nr:c-type cytochrome biogenesis protein CcmI [Sulfitobacter mediterraneus]MBM1312139.1 c-type cytochrome biogenesis protein CcmI [Sulfitobacter mediterraneus]MBM1316080.1 c-type cytochrome biogenesis protein CcmI [Sulfitobacter mediterraneus]MBM1324380.1 c-type cytochrome biogenesis protein CcmI [Sulfitobacter mediterraneus]MBM1328327.1 c-type cytochrome biogenesis protein CcmI [Sulfitobacter mediterraneus]MBM1399644.1 c-type cytochrome biogenesis protein CcmI [Sulfitobacter mediterraneus]